MKRVEKRLQKMYRDIKEVRIQGATNVARAAVRAYLLKPAAATKKRLLSLRPTEPMLSNALQLLDVLPHEKILRHFDEAQQKMNVLVYRLLKKKKNVFTHCHSTNVVKALIAAKKKGRIFEVVNTETRPLYQGRTTARELARAGIRVTTFVDSGMHEAIKSCDLVLMGADALLEKGVINKIGSAGIAEVAFAHHKPLYIVADSWKFSPRTVKIEERDFHEVWQEAPRHITIRNPAFELIEKKYVMGIVSELGMLDYDAFVKKVKKR